MLAELGKQHGSPFLERGELGSELFQFAVDTGKFGPRLPIPQIVLTVQARGEILDLSPEQPQPWVSVYRCGPVLELARIDRRVDLILRQPYSWRAVLSLRVAPLRPHSSP